MKHVKMQKKRSIKHFLLINLIAFVAFVILLLWVFQILLLDDIYSAIILRRLEKTADALTVLSDASELDEVASLLSHKNDFCTCIYKFENRHGDQIVSVHVSDSCLIHSVTSEALSALYANAKQSEDGVYIERFPLYGFNIANQTGNRELPDSSLPDSIIYTKLFKFADGSDGVIFLNCAVTPVDATVQTLTEMLGWISLFTIIAAVILAYILSHRISKPIMDMNREAKDLSGGNYNGEAFRGSYREIAELNETLTNASAELSKVENMQRELISNISHDLRTPLTLIEGYTEMMKEIPGENTPENMQVVIDETRRLSTLVNDLLEISRLRSSSAPLTKKRFNITETLRETVDRVTKLYSSDGYRIELFTVGDVFVCADSTRILQVIYNLIGNAVSYTGEDKTVTVKEEISNGFVRISVADTGEGIPQEDLPLIWNRYYKLDKVHRRGAGGSGIGLSIVKENLLLHNAKFGVSSTVGQGSVFWFELKTE